MELERPPTPSYVQSYLTQTIKSTKIHGHECSYEHCDIKNLKIEIHQLNGKYSIRTNIVRPPAWITANTKHSEIYSLYICCETGKIHHCHENCDGEKVLNDQNCNVCMISGLEYASESVRSWDISSRCVATVLQDKGDPYKFLRDSEGRVKKLSGTHNLKLTQCKLAAKETIHNLLFSASRIKSERHKYNEAKKESEKLIGKYRRHCEKHNQPKKYIQMVTIWVNRMHKKQNNSHFLIKSAEEQSEIVKTYTIEIIAYWRMILMKTSMGQETPSLFSFKIFTPSCMFLMKNGLQMGGIYIIKRHRYLDAALPEANNLDYYGYSKPSFTQLKNNILKAIRETIEEGKCTPMQFKEFVDSEKKRLNNL
jgi:hypothetical protein